MLKTLTVNLMTESVEDTEAFYSRVLGFETLVKMPGKLGKSDFAILQSGNVQLMLQRKESLEEEYPVLTCDKIRPTISLYITTDDLEQCCAAVQGKTMLLKELHETPYGQREIAIQDNNGYVITIAAHGE